MYRQLFNTLVTYDAQLNVQPQLAESWEYSEDRLTLTFKLRQGVTFHNGRDFTADDVVKNIERAKDDTLGHSVLGYTRPITAVTAVDPATVQFTFSEPANGIFDLLTVLGAGRVRTLWLLAREAKLGLLVAIMAAFGAIVSEVGASMIVGGNLERSTRVLTTAIVTETSRGEVERALSLGVVLLTLSFVVNLTLTVIQQRR